MPLFLYGNFILLFKGETQVTVGAAGKGIWGSRREATRCRPHCVPRSLCAHAFWLCTRVCFAGAPDTRMPVGVKVSIRQSPSITLPFKETFSAASGREFGLEGVTAKVWRSGDNFWESVRLLPR